MSLPGGIDFGRPPARRGGSLLLGFGVLLLAAGLASLAFGISLAVGQAGALADDAVATGVVGDGPVAFASEPGKLTVYLDMDGITDNSEEFDRISAATDCTATGRGFEDSFSGSRQGTAATLGDYVSVGSFTLPGSSGRIACTGPRTPFVLSPHSTGELFVSVGIIIAAVAVAGLGGWAAVAGWLRRRRAHQVGARQIQ